MKTFLLFFTLLLHIGLFGQGRHLSHITGVYETDKGGALIEVSLYDDKGNISPKDDSLISQSYVYIPAHKLPADAEIVYTRFRNSVPNIIETKDGHVYSVGISYDNHTPAPTDDLLLGQATFLIDAKQSEKILQELNSRSPDDFTIEKTRKAFRGTPSYEVKEVEEIK